MTRKKGVLGQTRTKPRRKRPSPPQAPPVFYVEHLKTSDGGERLDKLQTCGIFALPGRDRAVVDGRWSMVDGRWSQNTVVRHLLTICMHPRRFIPNIAASLDCGHDRFRAGGAIPSRTISGSQILAYPVTRVSSNLFLISVPVA